MIALQSEGLTKRYDNGRGCHDVSIQVQEGEAFGFLGPNGAGKSTFVKMLVGLTFPTEGRASLFGEPIGSMAARRTIGYLPELYRYQEWLTGEEVLRLHARLCQLSKSEADTRITELLDIVGIGLRSKDRVKHYSKGMQQRLGLACALIGDPKILFLDEPGSAMDPIGRNEVRGILHELKKQGKTIFLNSHLMEDMESLCDRVALMNDGRIIHQGKMEDVLLRNSIWRLRVGGFAPPMLDWLKAETGLPIGLTTHAGDGSAILEVRLVSDEQAGWLHNIIMELGMTLYETTRNSTRLEEWFIAELSGKNHRGERT